MPSKPHPYRRPGAPPCAWLRRLPAFRVSFAVWLCFALGLGQLRCSESDRGRVLAEFQGSTLYAQDVQKLFPGLAGQPDSAKVVQNYIRTWKLDQLLAEKAREQLPSSEQDIAFRVDDYRRKLLIDALYAHLVNTRLDTAISQQEMEAFFQENRRQFLANTELVNYHYVKTSNFETPELTRRLVSEAPAERDSALRWIRQNAETYKLDNRYFETRSLNDLQQVFTSLNVAALPASQRVYVSTTREPVQPDPADSTEAQPPQQRKFLHFLVIKDRIGPGEVLPLEQVNADIRRLIIAQRKQQLLQDYRQKMLVTLEAESAD